MGGFRRTISKGRKETFLPTAAAAAKSLPPNLVHRGAWLAWYLHRSRGLQRTFRPLYLKQVLERPLLGWAGWRKRSGPVSGSGIGRPEACSSDRHLLGLDTASQPCPSASLSFPALGAGCPSCHYLASKSELLARPRVYHSLGTSICGAQAYSGSMGEDPGKIWVPAGQGGQNPVFSVRGYNAGSPLEWAEVELMADLTLNSKGQLHSPTPPLSKITLVFSNPESSPTHQASLCSPSSLKAAQTYPEVV